MWPWQKSETRSASYSDEVLNHLLRQANASALADALQTLALEVAASTVGRAFTAAEVQGPIGPELEPWLGFIGRGFVRRGESLLVPSAHVVRGGKLVGTCPGDCDVALQGHGGTSLRRSDVGRRDGAALPAQRVEVRAVAWTLTARRGRYWCGPRGTVGGSTGERVGRSVRPAYPRPHEPRRTNSSTN